MAQMLQPWYWGFSSHAVSLSVESSCKSFAAYQRLAYFSEGTAVWHDLILMTPMLARAAPFRRA